MIQTETVQMLGRLSRAGLVRAMEGQSEVWAEALPDIRIEDAVTVTLALIRDNGGSDRWVTPGDIRGGVKALRLARHELASRNGAGLIGPPESIDGEDVQGQITWRRAFNGALGDGMDPDAADRAACRLTRATRAQIGTRDATAAIEATVRAMPNIPKAQYRPTTGAAA